MPRDMRQEYDGGIYHVIARGNNKEYIFKQEQDKGYFIKVLKEAMGADYQIYGFVLMDNHYHLIVQRHDKELHKLMHQVNNKYSKYFNAKYKRVGHVFQNRYKSILIQDERYLLSLLRYVHRNPVRAGMCKTVSDYKWSRNFFYEMLLLRLLGRNYLTFTVRDFFSSFMAVFCPLQAVRFSSF